MDVKEAVMPGGSRHVPARPGRVAPRTPARKGGKPLAGPGDTAAGSAAAAPSRREAPSAAVPDTDKITRVAEPVVHALGMDLESVKMTTAGRRRLLRLVVDSDRGVSLDDAALASRELSAKLDASDVMGEMPYTLEVSSPGVDRPLTQPRHWQRAAGRLVRVPLAPSGANHAKPGHGKPGAAAVQGRVVAADAAGVTLDIDGAHRRFDYAALGAGMVQIEFDRPGTTPDPGESPEEESPAGKRGPQRRGPGAEPDGH
ncbi:MAG: ribosome maturation factor RimP [Streptosporangiaceae bacterium]